MWAKIFGYDFELTAVERSDPLEKLQTHSSQNNEDAEWVLDSSIGWIKEVLDALNKHRNGVNKCLRQ